VKKKTGRPSLYTSKLAAAICKHLALGKSLRKTCKLPGMPTKTAVCEWLQIHDEFADLYARARQRGMEVHIEELIELADTANAENAQAVRLKVDTRKWIASKLLPRVYGDRLELAGDKERPLLVKVMRFGDAEPINGECVRQGLESSDTAKTCLPTNQPTIDAEIVRAERVER
jgi:hypothetical protein